MSIQMQSGQSQHALRVLEKAAGMDVLALQLVEQVQPSAEAGQAVVRVKKRGGKSQRCQGHAGHHAQGSVSAQPRKRLCGCGGGWSGALAGLGGVGLGG